MYDTRVRNTHQIINI